ncbi:MAG: tyrosine recombinase [Planctomycetes bacterium]|nr:tyrosine recombinase [Planctomycetota bacterium]
MASTDGTWSTGVARIALPDVGDVRGAAGQRELADFLVYLGVELQVSRHTVAAYRSDLQRLLRGRAALPDRDAIDRHLTGMLATHAPASVARAAAAIRGFYRFLQAEGLAAEDVAEGLLGPKLERKLPKALSRRAVARLLAVAADAADDPLARRDQAILQVLYATGCRVTEVVTLRTTSVIADHRLLRAFGKGNKERLVPISDAALACVQRYLSDVRPLLRARGKQDPGDVLFLSRTGRPLDRVRVFQVVRAACDRAGLTVACSPHALRHSFATHLVAGGADLRSVQEMLGHASLQTTQVYTHVDHERLRAVHESLHPRGAGARAQPSRREPNT